MRAITVKEPAANAIAAGKKKTENRTRRIALGPLVILGGGVALCIVDVVRVTGDPVSGRVRWHLANPRRVQPIPVRSFGWIVHVPERKLRPLVERKRRPKSGPYSLHAGRRTLDKGIRTPETARKLAAKFADRLGKYVEICRDGYQISGTHPSWESGYLPGYEPG